MNDALAYELAFWSNVANTFREEQKQLVYASRMGLRALWEGAHPPYFDLMGRSIIDVGGGPVSLLLKCVNLGRAVVLDPAPYPAWVLARYEHCGIEYRQREAEEPVEDSFDEAWCYNVLLHVRDPGLLVANALACCRTLRLFEWVNIPPYEGHPNELRRETLDEWLGAPGFTARIDEDGAVGECFYGVFKGRAD